MLFVQGRGALDPIFSGTSIRYLRYPRGIKMENALIVFQQICIMIFYLAIGLLLFHTKLITL